MVSPKAYVFMSCKAPDGYPQATDLRAFCRHNTKLVAQACSKASLTLLCKAFPLIRRTAAAHLSKGMSLSQGALSGLQISQPQVMYYAAAALRIPGRRHAGPRVRWQTLSRQAYKVDIETPSGVETITVEEGNTILQTALDQGIELTHDCKMGVCMTCPAKLVSKLLVHVPPAVLLCHLSELSQILSHRVDCLHMCFALFSCAKVSAITGMHSDAACSIVSSMAPFG